MWFLAALKSLTLVELVIWFVVPRFSENPIVVELVIRFVVPRCIEDPSVGRAC